MGGLFHFEERKNIFILSKKSKLLETMKSEQKSRVDLEQISGFCYWRAPLTPGRTMISEIEMKATIAAPSSRHEPTTAVHYQSSKTGQKEETGDRYVGSAADRRRRVFMVGAP